MRLLVLLWCRIEGPHKNDGKERPTVCSTMVLWNYSVWVPAKGKDFSVHNNTNNNNNNYYYYYYYFDMQFAYPPLRLFSDHPFCEVSLYVTSSTVIIWFNTRVWPQHSFSGSINCYIGRVYNAPQGLSQSVPSTFQVILRTFILENQSMNQWMNQCTPPPPPPPTWTNPVIGIENLIFLWFFLFCFVLFWREDCRVEPG